MKSGAWRSVLIALCFFFACVGTFHGEEKTGKQTPPPQPAPDAARRDTKTVLLEASRASTAKTVASASRKKTEGTEEKKSNEQAEDSAVTELRPVPPSEQNSSSKNSKSEARSGAPSNVHGTVVGGAGTAGGAAGASVGTTTKSGKTSIYVEGQRTREKDSRR